MQFRSSLRLVTKKWLLKNEKLATRLNNKTWTNPHLKTIKTIKRAMNAD